MQDGAKESLVKGFFKARWVQVVLVLNILLIIGIIVFAAINATKTSTIVFSIAPIDATISVNKDTSYNNGSYSIVPGKYDIQISHDGLESKSFSLDIKPNTTVTVSTFLSDSEKTFSFYTLRENDDSMQKLQEIAAAANNSTTDHDESAEEFIEDYNIKAMMLSLALPIDYSEYKPSQDSPSGQEISLSITIRNGDIVECKTSLCINVLMALTDDKELAKKLMKEKGINPDDYEIVYKTY